ncbi:MAG: type VII toxin-antitoxin system MntA family adenylyltransferase antitoxin [Myxococcota bacterium]
MIYDGRVDRVGIARKLEAHFGADPAPPAAVYLFGSLARGEARPDSDVDVAILYARDGDGDAEARRLDVEGDLERILRRPVDLVVLDHAPVDLVHRVLREGVLVHEADRAARVRFEVHARNEYFDLVPFLRRYRRMPEAEV